MPVYLIRRLAYALPIMLGVSFLCFMLVHISPGDPLVSILPADASAELQPVSYTHLTLPTIYSV